MKKNYITKTIGGLTIMFSIFLFFAAAKQMYNLDENIAASITSGTARQTSEARKQQAAVDEHVIKGTFNPESSGNIRYSYDEKKTIKFYYMAIKSPKLKSSQINPVLKLEVTDDSGTKKWQKTSWKWIDYNQGVLYFHYMTEEDGEKEMAANYTGKYQIILDN